MKSIIQKLIFLRSRLHSVLDKCFCKHWPDIERMGQKSGWHVKTSELNSHSVIYSAGAGKDVSFEISLVKRFGSKVYLVDPSPTGIKTMALPENQSEDVFFFPIGLAGESGTLEFGEPSNPEEGSFTIADQNTKRVQFQCTSVGDFMKKNGHTHLDLLKMDVEGCEYAVLDSIFREHLRIRMICCEFHHFLPGYSRLLTLRYILRLRREGYSLIYKDHHDYTFYAPGKLAIT